MKKIKFVLGFIATLSSIVGIGSLVGFFICIVPNMCGKVFFGALGVLLVTTVVWVATSEPEEW